VEGSSSGGERGIFRTASEESGCAEGPEGVDEEGAAGVGAAREAAAECSSSSSSSGGGGRAGGGRAGAKEALVRASSDDSRRPWLCGGWTGCGALAP